MSLFLRKIREFFISKEKIFTNMLIEELGNKDFINLRKFTLNLSIQQRYKITNKLISNGVISGILLPATPYFLSIPEVELIEIKNQLKKSGNIHIPSLKEKWRIKDKYLELLLLHFEKGIFTFETYYTIKYLREYILSTLKNEEEYDIKLFNKNLGVELDDLAQIILMLIDEELLFGVLHKGEMFLNSTRFEEILFEYIEEKSELANEVNFDEISSDLKVSLNFIEKYLVNIVEKTSGIFVVYPLEKKIIFKK